MLAVDEIAWEEGRCFHSPLYLSSQMTQLLGTSYALGSVFTAANIGTKGSETVSAIKDMGMGKTSPK